MNIDKTNYVVGKKYLARLSSDDGSPKLFDGKKIFMYDCEAVIETITNEKMIVSVFADVWRKHEYSLDGVRLDGEAYLVEGQLNG